jgi:hypothetical protein
LPGEGYKFENPTLEDRTPGASPRST